MDLFPKAGLIGADSASVYYLDSDSIKWRLPWGTGEYNEWYADYPQRNIREVATERSLMNAGGIFYELPREISGGIQKIKPVSTHNRKIIDYCSWRGMMAISGTKTTAVPDGRFYGKQEFDAGLWLGTIDDLWSFGKPTGIGGPWKNSEVGEGEFSDPYLMLGFDKKELLINHNSAETVSFELFADFTGSGEFILIEVIKVEQGKTKSFNFPKGFSANWVKIRVNMDCSVTARFIYM